VQNTQLGLKFRGHENGGRAFLKELDKV